MAQNAIALQLAINDFFNDFNEMFNKVIDIHRHLLKTVQKQNFNSKDFEKINAEDLEIDRLRNGILENGLWIITTQQPISKELRQVIGIMNCAGDLERIGDYAKNIAVYFSFNPNAGEIHKILVKLGNAFLSNAQELQKAFLARDYQMIILTGQKDKIINDLFEKSLHKLYKKINENSPQIIESLHGAILAAKNYERGGDHLVNISEKYSFIEKGYVVEIQ